MAIDRFTTTSSMRCVMSNSVIAPARSGRTATTLPESPPIRSQTSSPIAEHLAGAAVQRDHRRLVEDDAVALAIHERVRRAQVDRQVAPHQLPITQWASPETSASFFQMGTSSFRRSIP